MWLYLAEPHNDECECVDIAYANAGEYLYAYQQINYPVMVRPDDESEVLFVIAQ